MTDNLIIPIGFDLEGAVKKAGQEWNNTYADKLEKLLAKWAINTNLGFSTKNLNNLDDVRRRLAELKIEPLTPEKERQSLTSYIMDMDANGGLSLALRVA